MDQVNGEFEAKDDNMRMYLQQRVKDLIPKFENFTPFHIPRTVNAQADSLARLASSVETSEAYNIIWEVLSTPSINILVATIDRSESWVEPRTKFLQNNTLPEDEYQAKVHLKQENSFEFHHGTL